MKIKRGDIVARMSYHKDILFVVEKVLNANGNRGYTILKGLTVRVVADSPICDLVPVDPKEVQNNIFKWNKELENRLQKNTIKRVEKTGRILHLDGDRRYSQKSTSHYRKIGLNAIVRNIAENKQTVLIKNLIYKYKPDILIITGHDAMLKKSRDYNNVYNYKNSRHFINTVKRARECVPSLDDLVIFAGACQSYYEGLMQAGANFASSPERIMIDFMDPLVIAEKVATTDKNKYITLKDLIPELREGNRGIGGTRARGKKEIILV